MTAREGDRASEACLLSRAVGGADEAEDLGRDGEGQVERAASRRRVDLCVGV